MATVYKLSKGDRHPDILDPETGEITFVQMFTREVMGNAVETCSFCGEQQATGYWIAHHTNVSCCPNCAVEVLPRLMADSLICEKFTPTHGQESINRSLQTILKNFWQSVAIAILGVWCHQSDEQ